MKTTIFGEKKTKMYFMCNGNTSASAWYKLFLQFLMGKAPNLPIYIPTSFTALKIL